MSTKLFEPMGIRTPMLQCASCIEAENFEARALRCTKLPCAGATARGTGHDPTALALLMLAMTDAAAAGSVVQTATCAADKRT
jgi:hypothetical protein